MVTIIQRARVYIRRRERRKKGISLPVDTQASEGGVANGWRFGEFALLILLRVVLRLKILGGGARGGAYALLHIPHITTRILTLISIHALGRDGRMDVAACCTNRLLRYLLYCPTGGGT